MTTSTLGLGWQDHDELSVMLADSAQSFLNSRHDMGRRVRALRDDPIGYDKARWLEMAELGWLSLRVPENHGGAGLEPAHVVLLARLFGGKLLNEPFIAAGLLPSLILSRLLPGVEATALLSTLTSGQEIFAVGWQEEAGQLEPEQTSIAFARDGNHLRIDGKKMFIPFAAGSTQFLVTGRLDGEFALVNLAAGSDGVDVRPSTLIDGAPSGSLTLLDARGDLLAKGDVALAAVQHALAEATLALAAELVGIASAVLEITAEFMRTRVQFGKPIGAFQALQHRLVDYYNQVRLADASVNAAAQTMAAAPARSVLAVSTAKARAAETAQLVTAGAIQLHGAIGYTDEYDIGLYLKGAIRRSSWLGNAKSHRARALTLLRPLEAVSA